ncbi:MAG: hypothetical protein ABWY13_05995, partial [Mesorhizobium sp.]
RVSTIEAAIATMHGNCDDLVTLELANVSTARYGSRPSPIEEFRFVFASLQPDHAANLNRS